MSWGKAGCMGEVCRGSMCHRKRCGWTVPCSAPCPGVPCVLRMGQVDGGVPRLSPAWGALQALGVLYGWKGRRMPCAQNMPHAKEEYMD